MTLTPYEKFNIAVTFVLKHEGKFSYNKNDPGDETNYGISVRFLKMAGLDINEDGKINIKDILAIDENVAKKIYKRYWWDVYNYEAIDDISICSKVFDLAINIGQISAVKILQNALMWYIYPSSIKVDGILGQLTINYVNDLCKANRGTRLLNQIIKESCDYYQNLVKKNIKLYVFLGGWINRANDKI